MESKKIYYNHTLSSDKYYFGGYFNLAQNNIELVLEAYKKRFKEEDLNKLKDTKLSDSDFNIRVDYLGRHLPFVHYIDKADRAEFGKKLCLLIGTVNRLRNFYTHHYHKPLSFDECFYTALDDLFLKVVKDVRKNRLKTDETKLLLKNKLKDELDILLKTQKERLLEDKAKGKKVSLDDESIRNSLLNQAVRHLIYKDKESEEEKVSKYYKSKQEEGVYAENGIAISQSGIVFLLGLFLTKKESEHLRAQTKGFKAKTKDIDNEYPNLKSNSLKYMATHWVFSYLSFKGVKNQLVSSYDKEALLIQIADELSKVPDAVYSALPKELQESFVEDMNEYIKEENETHSLSDSIVIHPVIRKRYEDKFNYFALRYIDEFLEFPSLRFQIHMGNYVHDRREKNIAGTLYHTERIVKERINVFARLSEASKLKGDAPVLKDNNEIVGWERFPNPSYNIEEGNIMIHLKVDKDLDDRIKIYRSERNKNENRARRDENKIGKYKITLDIGKKDKINYDEPVASLSLNELSALLYEILKRRATPEQIEKQICKRIREQFNKIENYQMGDRLSLSQIPSKLLKSSQEASIDTRKLLIEIEKEIDVTHQKLSLIRNNRAETKKIVKGRAVRRLVFNSRERGKEATWLTYDLLRLMPSAIRKEWKGYQHSQLQRSLALYDTRYNEAFNILESVWNLGDDTYSWNSRIKEAFKEKSFDCFFEKYLILRLDIYTNLKDAIDRIDNKGILKKALKQQHVWNLFPERNFRIDTTQNLKEKLLAKPIVLSRGIFDEKPTFIKGVNIHEQPEQFADWYKYATCSQERYQRFYDYERDYKELFEQNKLRPEKERKKSIEKLAIENDLYIKKQKTQDLFMKLMAESLYEQVFEHKATFSLEDFYLIQEERLEQIKRANKQNRREKGDTSENIIKESFIWNMTVPYKHGAIEENAIKLKNIGKFKRLLIDSRIKRILEYVPDRKWRKIELENELESYEKIRREQLLMKIQTLESNILQTNGFDGIQHPPELEQKGNPNFKCYIVNGLLRKRDDVSDADLEWLLGLDEKTFECGSILSELKMKPLVVQKGFMIIYIRNKIGHNQMLFLNLFNFMLELCGEQVSDKETFSDTLLRCTNKIINTLQFKGTIPYFV